MTISSNIKVLGIETSCDDTAAAVVDGDGNILSNVVLGQDDEHNNYGGIVPEIAARAHANHLDDIIRKALTEAKTSLDEISAIAVTAGPGLIGGVMVGVVSAKAIALATGKPIFGINHLEGHALTPRLTNKVPYPYLLLLISGGHCQLVEVEGLDSYNRLGTTIDDAAGEAFDKTAKLLELGSSGGLAVEQMANTGDKNRFNLPRPLSKQKNYDFSFSGLKTALRREVEMLIEKSGQLNQQDKADLCASLQSAIADSLANKTKRAMEQFKVKHGQENKPNLVVAGGVAANKHIRGTLEKLSQEQGFNFTAPPIKLCTDNAAMIAWAGIERMAAGQEGDASFIARPRWPLDGEAQPKVGFGKKGAKA